MFGVTLHAVLLFSLASAVIGLAPGPSVLFVVARSIERGWRAGVLSAVGNTVGGFPAVMLTSFGLGALIESSDVVMVAIRVVGAVYLVWLGVQSIRHRNDRTAVTLTEKGDTLRLFVQSVVVGLTNPKVLAFLLIISPQFVDSERAPVWAQLFTLGIVFLGVTLACRSAWAVVAGSARNWFAQSSRRLSLMSATGGTLMISLGVVMAVAGGTS